jgi:hypothetical protein
MAQGEEEIRIPGGGGPVGPPPTFDVVQYCGDITANQNLTTVPIYPPNVVQTLQQLNPNTIYVDCGDIIIGQGYNYIQTPDTNQENSGCCVRYTNTSTPTPEQTYIRYIPCSECGDQPFTSNTPTNGLDLDGQTVSFPGGNTPTCCFTALLVVGESGSPLDVTFDWDNNPPPIITYNDCDTCQNPFSGDDPGDSGTIECPPEEAITLVEDVYLGIESSECCNEDVTGDNSVYWDTSDFKNPKCRRHLTSTVICQNNFESFTFEDLGDNTIQVFGVLSDQIEPISLNESCCTSDIVGTEVVWDSELGICKILLSDETPVLPTISLNQDLIDATECDDLIVSVKIFFNEPEELCAQNLSCYLLPDNPNINVEQIAIFDLVSDGYNTWVDLAARFQNVDGNPFNLKLVFDGLTDCCDYDLLFDDVRIDCFSEEERVTIQQNKCVGFDLTKVIDNKKSWVYNVGTPEIGDSEIDNIIRRRGDRTLLESFGFVNRKFAPSQDADLPWRYTDYYEQSNILEPHSKSVINSKELYLTFDMCSDCCAEYGPCPNGYTLSAGTETCYKNVLTCPNGYTLSAGTCYSGVTTTSATTTIETIDSGKYCVKSLTLLEIEEYKKVFQEFWVRMIEQFVPATTIFVSGEKWCNNDTFICTEFEECDYDYEYVESEITVIQYGTDFNPDDTNEENGGDTTDGPKINTPIDNESDGNPRDSQDGPIFEDGITVISTGGEPSGNTDITDSGPFGPTPEQVVTKRIYNSTISRGNPRIEFV